MIIFYSFLKTTSTCTCSIVYDLSALSSVVVGKSVFGLFSTSTQTSPSSNKTISSVVEAGRCGSRQSSNLDECVQSSRGGQAEDGDVIRESSRALAVLRVLYNKRQAI